MLDANFERNKGKLSEMEIIEQERQDKLAASRQVSPSPAEFFARVFRLRKGVRMYIGLEGGTRVRSSSSQRGAHDAMGHAYRNRQ